MALGVGLGKEQRMEMCSWDQVQRGGHGLGLSSYGVCSCLCKPKQVLSGHQSPFNVLAFELDSTNRLNVIGLVWR